MSTLRIIPPNYIVCVDLVTSLGYSITGVSTAFRKCRSYALVTIPKHRKSVAVVDLGDAKGWLEKKSRNNPKASTVLSLLSNADFSRDTFVPQSSDEDDFKITLLDITQKKQESYCVVEVMADLKESRRQSALYLAELAKQRMLYAECRAELLNAKAEIAS